mgnify:FL=1
MNVERIELTKGYSISRLIKGGWHLAGGHGTVDPAQAIKDMATFVEHGITTFDCADHYTGVEELIGKFRTTYPELAKSVQIHTKIVPDYDRLATVDRQYVESIIDRSLKRLRVEQLDLVQYYWWDPDKTPGFVETALVLNELREAGKIARIGATNFNTSHLRTLLEANVPIVTNQPQYSLIDVRPEQSFIPCSLENNISQLCYGTLAGGFISFDWIGKSEPLEPFPNRSLTKYKLIIEDFGGWDTFQQLLRCLKTVADKYEVTVPVVALRWVLDKPGVAAAIVGATSTLHITENLRVFGFSLTPGDNDLLDSALKERSGPVGDCYDLERDKTGRHGQIMRYNQNQLT